MTLGIDSKDFLLQVIFGLTKVSGVVDGGYLEGVPLRAPIECGPRRGP